MRAQVDLTFNNAMAVRETAFFVDTLAHSTVAMELFVWLKYWSAANQINNPKAGTLSSFGWRCLLVSVLIRAGILPCLREGVRLAISMLFSTPCACRILEGCRARAHLWGSAYSITI